MEAMRGISEARCRLDHHRPQEVLFIFQTGLQPITEQASVRLSPPPPASKPHAKMPKAETERFLDI